MSPQPHKRGVPCDLCRDKHLKCDSQTPCSNCTKSSNKCVRSRKKIRFKHLVTSQEKFTWINVGSLSGNKGAKFTTEYDGDDVEYLLTKGKASEGNQRPEGILIPPVCDKVQSGHASRYFQPSSSVSRATETSTSEDRDIDTDISNPGESSYNILPVLDKTCRHVFSETSSTTGDGSNISTYEADAIHYSQTSMSPGSNTKSPTNEQPPRLQPEPLKLSFQEACLLRFFIENLAMVFDTSDRNHSYFTLLPIRAIHSPLLLNAICTASARTLTQRWSHHDSKSTIEYDGVALPNLTMESAIYYHNNCISYLMDVSADQRSVCSDDAITAITILRYHEQVDMHFTGIDNEIYTAVVMAMFKPSHDEGDGLLSIIKQPPPDSNVYASSISSLRHSACLIALRQEIWSVLIHQRSFRLPLATFYDYNSLNHTIAVDDYDWTNVVILWCAHVLQYCFGGEGDLNDETDRSPRNEQLDVLKQFLQTWDESPPPYFAPIFSQDRNPAEGRYFPTIWVANRCQILALQHIELARIVLLVHENCIEQVHHDLGASDAVLQDILRNATRRICGLAMSNQKYQEAMVSAAVGLSMCGKYFRDSREQAAIIDLIENLKKKHAWPTDTLYNTLQQAWATYNVV